MPTDDVARLVDDAAIVRVCLDYGRALDQKDWQSLRACFLEDAVAEYEGIAECHGIEAIIDLTSGGLGFLDQSQHILTNFLVDVAGDHANSSCYLQAQHVRRGSPGGDNFIIAGRYADALVRTPDGWRIKRRVLSVWWTDGNPQVVAKPDSAAFKTQDG